MFNWLKKKSPHAASDSVTTPPVAKKPAKKPAIRYNPNLIVELKRDHQHLLKEYGAINAALSTEDYPRIAELLENFDEGLRTHLAREHVELYIYLEYILARDTESFRQMHDLRQEMDRISTAVMTFLNTYQNKPVTHHNATLFRQQLEGIGSVLSGRIQREESSLYNLYREK